MTATVEVATDPERVALTRALVDLECVAPHERAHLAAQASELEADAQAIGDETLAHRARLVHADANSRSGRDAAAARDIREVNRWAARTGQRFLVARSHRHLAAIALLADDVEMAHEHAQRCVQNTGEDTPARIAADHAMLHAVTLGATGHEAASMAEFDRADSLAIAGHDTWLRLHLLNNRAYALYVCDNMGKALDSVNEMISVADAENLGLTPGMLETQARVLLATGLPSAAMRVLLPAGRRDPAPGSADAAEIAACRLTLARAQVELGKVDNAYMTLDQCEELAGRLVLPRIRASVRQARARLHASQGRWQEAYEEHLRYHDLALTVLSPIRDARGGLSSAPERDSNPDLTQVAVSHDPLTGLPNRRFVASRLPELLTVMGEHDLPLGVAMIDLDRFSEVNAVAGADGANEVLVAFADILERHLGDHQVAARLGGEEFLLVLPAADDALVAAFCEQVRCDLHAHRWSAIHPEMPTVTASFGVAVAYPDDELSQMELLRIADANLYHAKRSGRDSVVLGDETTGRTVSSGTPAVPQQAGPHHQPGLQQLGQQLGPPQVPQSPPPPPRPQVGPAQPQPVAAQAPAAQAPPSQAPFTQVPAAGPPEVPSQDAQAQLSQFAHTQATQFQAAQQEAMQATQARLAQVRAAQAARAQAQAEAEAEQGEGKDGQTKWWNKEIRLRR